MFVLTSRTSLPRGPIDSLKYGLFLRRPSQFQTPFVCLCSDPHTKGHKHCDALKETTCQMFNCSDARTNRSVWGLCNSDVLGVQLFSCTIVLITLLIRDIGFGLFYSIHKSREILCCVCYRCPGSIIFIIIEPLTVKQCLPRVTHFSLCFFLFFSLITRKVVEHKVIGEKKGRMEKVWHF